MYFFALAIFKFLNLTFDFKLQGLIHNRNKNWFYSTLPIIKNILMVKMVRFTIYVHCTSVCTVINLSLTCLNFG